MLHLNLRNKFILYFFPLILCVFIFGGYCIFTFSSIHKQFGRLQREIAPNAVAMLELKEILLSLEQGIKEIRFMRNEIIYVTIQRNIWFPTGLIMEFRQFTFG